MMKNSFQKSNFLYYGIILVSVSDHDLSIRESGTASLSKFYWIFSFSCTLPSNLISSCKTKWALGLLDDMGAFPHV
ncbi:Uncharacterised protein [Streptococcus pneumoniae]|nr:Uncharacterised protein [Streptococcus pneumoniae]VOA90764.1 Uncharacterised protein [Streptococcus pneumoniae]VQI85195.1 Uncharacterised protein [Streptococcus pneumoniae]VRV00269.1 Uncharacterised protein [Streptococcus pneumoniae]